MAPVLGRDFEYPPLAAALRTSSASAVAALDPAVSARLVCPEGSRAGAYRFVHALIRDAVEEQLAPSRRAELNAGYLPHFVTPAGDGRPTWPTTRCKRGPA